MTNSKYKFNENLLKLSKNQNLVIAKSEWREIYKEHREEKGICICQHKIKNIVYMYNIFTKYTISVGEGCCKKFDLKRIKVNSIILKNVLSKMIANHEYETINNVIEYSNDIQIQLIEYIREKIKYTKCCEILNQILNNVRFLIYEYDLKYLQEIYFEIKTKKGIVENENREKQYIEFLKREKQRIENEEQDQRIQKEKREKEEKESLRIKLLIDEVSTEYENNITLDCYSCKCGIIKINLCLCETPIYKLQKLSNNYYCQICNKWKCRCIDIN